MLSRPAAALLIACFALPQLALSQWNPDAGLIQSFTVGASTMGSSNGTASNVIDGDEGTFWQSGAPLPLGYINRKDLNILWGLGAAGYCSGTGVSNCISFTDGNLNTATTVTVVGTKARLTLTLPQPAPLRNMSVKCYAADTVFIHVFRSNTDSSLVGVYPVGSNYTTIRFSFVSTPIIKVKLSSKLKFSLFEVAALSDYPSEFVIVDLKSVKTIGVINTRHWAGGNAIATKLYVSSDSINWQFVADLNPGALNGITTNLSPAVNGRYVKILHKLVEADNAKVFIWEASVFDDNGRFGPMPAAVRGKINLSSMLGVNGIWGWGYNMFSNSLSPGQGPTKFNQVCTHARNYHNLHWDVTDPDNIPNYNGMPGSLAVWWLDWDREYLAWKAANLKVGVTIQYNNNTMPQSSWNNPYTAAYNYAYTFARHFGPTYGNGRVEFFEAGNEPWDYPASFYNQVQQGMIQGAKAGDSALIVLPCALQSYNPFKETSTGGNYMGARLTQQDAPYIDAINVHHYSYTNNPDGVRISLQPESKQSELHAILNDIRFRDANLPGKKIYVTEWGWDSDGASEDCTFGECVSESEQALYGVRGALMFLRLGIDRISWYFYGNQASGHVYSRCGMESTTHVNKKSYSAFQSLVKRLGTKFFLQTLREDDDAWVYVFGDASGVATHLAAWMPSKGDDTASAWITIPNYLPDSAWTITGNTSTGEYVPGRITRSTGYMTCKISSAPLVIKISNVDCNGVINGTAILDQCGICGGDNSTCTDCAGVINGTAIIDDCGICSGGTTRIVPNSAKDCMGVCFGSAMRDSCGICNGDNSACKDCNGVVNGTAFIDGCGICSNGNTGHVANSDMDCSGVCFGTAVPDVCGVCNGNNSTCNDCNGVPNGGAFIDACGICSGGNTGHVANSNKDCNGDCFGTAYLNSCGVCVGGNAQCQCVGGMTNLTVVYSHGPSGATVNVYKKKVLQPNNLIVSFTNVMEGDTLFVDASGLPNGKFESSTYFHIAGTNNSAKIQISTSCPQSIQNQTFGYYTVIGFTDLNGNVCGGNLECIDCNGVLGGGALLDQCGVCEGDNSTCKDCAGVPNGGAFIDDCGICSGGTTGHAANSNKDCNGVCFGTALSDNCGVCEGNNSTCTGATIIGPLMKWHRVTFLFTGVNTSESATPNPFLDYRLIVTFTNGAKTYQVQGHYAADGNAAQTSATTGNKWRVYFNPDETGTWNYSVSYRTGTNIALDNNPANGAPVASLDGQTGSFVISASNKTGNDFRAKGRLNYVGQHYLQFAETGEYFLKGGADSPENFLGYWEFDGTFDDSSPTDPPELTNGLHRYAPHVADWHSGDPTWKSGKGKGIIGALNYLASRGMNSVYFLTYNIDGGDGKDVWMWTSDTERYRFDVSKLDQWEIVFSQMDSLGIQLHVVTQEIENQNSLGGADVTGNNLRALYYRELVSRFSHHLAVVWNIGEENTTGNATKVANARYIREKDAYRHPITVHTPNNGALGTYQPLMDNSTWIQYFEMTSLQGDAYQYNSWADTIRDYSASKGKKWVICGDEQTPDVLSNMSNLYTLRRDALWGNLLGGGGGVEWYFGYQGTFGDLSSEDWSVAQPLWDNTKYALDFMHAYLPLTTMQTGNNLFSASGGGYCFYKAGEVYAIYLKNGGYALDVMLTVPPGTYYISWYNPRTGGALLNGSLTTSATPTGGTINMGRNPASDSNDWVMLVRNSGGANNNPPSVSITSPANNAVFTAPASITINANASDIDGIISKVQFFQGTTLLGEDLTSPYSFNWTGVQGGSYPLAAKAFDNSGASATSSIVNVRVDGMVVSITESALPSFCQGVKIILTAQSSVATSYQWSTGATDNTIEVTSSGTYSVTAYDGSGNSATQSLPVNLDASNLISAYTLLATSSLTMNNNTVVSGGVGSTGAGSTAQILNNSVITAAGTFVKADNVIVTGSSVSQVMTDPVTVTLPTFENSASPGNAPSVTVPANITMTLTGSAYRDISAANNSTVIFSSPDINLWSLATTDNVTIRFAACAKLKVKNSITLGVNNTFNPDNSDVIVFAGKSVSIGGGGATINTDLYTKSTLTILDGTANDHNQMKGMFIGNVIDAGSYTDWQWILTCSCGWPAAKLSAPGDENHIPYQPASYENDVMINAYPNPFKEKLNIEFTLPADSRARLEVYNVTGQLLQVLYDGQAKSYRQYHVEFNPVSISGGIVIYRLQTETGSYYDKAVMVR